MKTRKYKLPDGTLVYWIGPGEALKLIWPGAELVEDGDAGGENEQPPAEPPAEPPAHAEEKRKTKR